MTMGEASSLKGAKKMDMSLYIDYKSMLILCVISTMEDCLSQKDGLKRC